MCWGKNNYGQLGDGSTTNRSTPVPLNSGFIRPGLRFMEITAGADHTCGLTSDGRAWCWGYNNNGQLGDNSTIRGAHPLPAAVEGGLVFTRLAAGEGFTCGIADQTGIAHCWGGNYGPAPVAVAGTGQFVQLAAGGRHACGATAAGAASCWNDATTMNGSAQAVAVAGGLTFRQLTAGSDHTFGLASDGRAYLWGQSLGNLSSGIHGTVPSVGAGGLTFTQIAAGAEHTCGVASGGIAYCWGMNDFDQLGLGAPGGAAGGRRGPTAVVGGARFLQVASRGNHSCGVATDGTVWCWGSNAFGQAGDGSMAAYSRPVQALLPR